MRVPLNIALSYFLLAYSTFAVSIAAPVSEAAVSSSVKIDSQDRRRAARGGPLERQLDPSRADPNQDQAIIHSPFSPHGTALYLYKKRRWVGW